MLADQMRPQLYLPPLAAAGEACRAVINKLDLLLELALSLLGKFQVFLNHL
jgi:hypothetical protein